MVRNKKFVYLGFVLLSVAVLAFVVLLTISVGTKNRGLLEESIKSQLITACSAALTKIDVDEFVEYKLNDAYKQNEASYVSQIVKLTKVKDEVNATYIYAVKKDALGNEFYIVLDTDTVDNASFQKYEISEVHKAAFNGRINAGIMNVSDKYGSFNTGAAPIKRNGLVVGIICVDITDTLVSQSVKDFRINMILLILVLVVLFALSAFTLFKFLTRVALVEEELDHMANYDKLTDLPNRRCLLRYLEEHSVGNDNDPLALFFIDIDNFKRVNDSAGHEAGDAFLIKTGEFLDNIRANSKVFRPGSGKINITARIGGDEFIIIAPNISDEEGAAEFAKEILNGFNSKEFNNYISKYEVGLSIGIALYPKHSDNYHVLIRYADIAMYNAKNASKNCYKIYNDEMKMERS